MISDYKFQDLAKFIEDVKFLIAKDGGASLAQAAGGGTTIELIFRIIKLFLLWVFLIILIYMIYKIIFYGYPRFPIDLMKFKLNNKVDVKKVVGDVNGPLYKQVTLFKEPRMEAVLEYFNKKGFLLLNEECDKDNCKSIFHDLDRIIDEEYGESKEEEALNNYYKYYQVITSRLGLNGLTSYERITKVREVLDNVFTNYFDFYRNEILIRENSIQCMRNDGKDDAKREKIKQSKTRLIKELETIMKNANCVRVNTECEFARLFVDPNFSLECTEDKKKLVEAQLNRMNTYKEKKNRYKKLEREIKDKERKLQFSGFLSAKDKRKTKQQLAERKNEKNQVKIEIIDITREATRIVEDNMKNSPPGLSIKNPTYKDIIKYDGDERILPDTNRDIARNKSMQYTVYVPFYDMYKKHYEINKKNMYDNLGGSSVYGMTHDEIIAYIFLTDLEKFMYNVELKKIKKENIELKPVLIQQINNTYIAIENITGRVSGILTNQKSPIETAKYLIFPDDNTLVSSIAEFDKYKKEVKDYYDEYEQKVQSISISNEYTYYLMEIFAYILELKGKNPGRDVDYIYDRYVNQFSKFQYNKSALISYLNLPVALQNNDEIRKKFGITKRLIMFIKSHPLFALLHLNSKSTSNPKDKYHDVMSMFIDLLSDNPKLQGMVYKVDKANMTEVEEVLGYVQKRVFEIKEFIVSLHLLNIYFTHYRDSVVEKDPISKVKISRDGFVEIYDQQNISHEFSSFFGRLFEPFKRDFLDGKIKAAWIKAFVGKGAKANKKFNRLNPNLKEDKYNLSYWREFNSFWVDFMGKKMDGMMKLWWKNFKNYTKERRF
jgi:hypothetical protein